jgi:ADP-ribose pyrophosphatase
MIKWILFMTCLITLHASEKSRLEYLDLIQEYPLLVAERGDAEKGEIEILTTPEKMAEIEEKTGRDVGLIKKDKYWTWVNDAVRFPSGAEGVYSRMLWNRALVHPDAVGVCVMPVTDKNEVVLNCNYRHATRSWELELPRGGINEGETIEDAARRETLEETGKIVSELTLLGSMAPDTGAMSTIVPIYLAIMTGSQENSPESSEAIEQNIVLSMLEVKKAIAYGYYDCNIRGEIKRVHCRDPFLAYAILMCIAKKPK